MVALSHLLMLKNSHGVICVLFKSKIFVAGRLYTESLFHGVTFSPQGRYINMDKTQIECSSQARSLSLSSRNSHLESLKCYSFSSDASTPRSLDRDSSLGLAQDSPRSSRRSLLAKTCYDNMLRVRRLNLDVDPLSNSNDSSSQRQTVKEVYDVMEREQDAIVLRLMREIGLLNAENVALKRRFSISTSLPPTEYPLRRNSSRSLCFPHSLLPSSHSSGSFSQVGSKPRSSSLNSHASDRRYSISLMLAKEVLSAPRETILESTLPVDAQVDIGHWLEHHKSSAAQQRLLEENTALRREIMRLQRELSALKHEA